MTAGAPVVVITGASAGIGYELARAWARRGARLVLNARAREKLEAACASVRTEFPEATLEAVAGDVTNAEIRDALVERARARFGRLDVLVNNAGRGYYARIESIQLEPLERLFALNVLAPLALTQRALPALIETKGTVVMISSVAGVAAAPAMGAYAASKFALEALSLSLRAEVARRGVRVSVVRPGPVATEFREHAVAGDDTGLASPSTEADDRQSARDVAERVVRGVAAGHDVIETSLYVRGASFLSRTLPPVFRLVTRRMAKS